MQSGRGIMTSTSESQWVVLFLVPYELWWLPVVLITSYDQSIIFGQISHFGKFLTFLKVKVTLKIIHLNIHDAKKTCTDWILVITLSLCIAISYYPKVNIFQNFGDPAKSALLDPPFFEEGYICQRQFFLYYMDIIVNL